MPQIWMTYEELAEILGCDTETARATTIQRALDRKKSRDGLTRAKLDSELTAKFVAAIRNADVVLEQAIRDLHNMHARMSDNGRTNIGRSAASG